LATIDLIPSFGTRVSMISAILAEGEPLAFSVTIKGRSGQQIFFWLFETLVLHAHQCRKFLTSPVRFRASLDVRNPFAIRLLV